MASAVGERIRLGRQALGLTQEEFAARVGVSPSAVLDWEKGRYFPSRHQGMVEFVLGFRLSGENDVPAAPTDPRERRVFDLLLQQVEGMTPAEALGIIDDWRRREGRRSA